MRISDVICFFLNSATTFATFTTPTIASRFPRNARATHIFSHIRNIVRAAAVPRVAIQFARFYIVPVIRFCPPVTLAMQQSIMRTSLTRDRIINRRLRIRVYWIYTRKCRLYSVLLIACLIVENLQGFQLDCLSRIRCYMRILHRSYQLGDSSIVAVKYMIKYMIKD